MTTKQPAFYIRKHHKTQRDEKVLYCTTAHGRIELTPGNPGYACIVLRARVAAPKGEAFASEKVKLYVKISEFAVIRAMLDQFEKDAADVPAPANL